MLITQIPWTNERCALLRTLWADGLSVSQIAKEIGGTRNSIIGKAIRLDLPARQARGAERKKRNPESVRKQPKNSFHKPHRIGGNHAMKSDGILHRIVVPKHEPVINIVDQEIPESQRCTFFQLKNNTCRWPVGEPGEAGFFFCGSTEANNELGRPYCPGHAARACEPLGARRTRRSAPPLAPVQGEEAA